MKRKILTILVGMALFIPIISVKAEAITTKDIANKMKEVLKKLDEDYDVTATDNLITVSTDEDGENSIVEISYNDSILEYLYSYDNDSESLFKWNVDYALTISAYGVKGYDFWMTRFYQFDKDFETTTLENDGIEKVMSLEGPNSTKIDLSKISIPESQKTPVVKVPEVTSNSITLTLSLEGDDGVAHNCMVVRENEDGSSEYFTETNGFLVGISCSEMSSVTDDNLEPNKTYKYKAYVLGNSNFGETIEVTTKAKAEDKVVGNDDKDTNIKQTSNTVESPKTGVETYTTAGLVLLVVTAGVYTICRKKDKINRI